MVTSASGYDDTKLATQMLAFVFCVVAIITCTTYLSSHPVSLPVFYGLEEKLVTLHRVFREESTVFRSVIVQALVWMMFVSPVDSAIPCEGARVVSGWSSPGHGESGPWFYRAVLGSTVVPAEAVLDPQQPHWSFPGQAGHITFKLHRNATLTAIVIKSDFPNSIPPPRTHLDFCAQARERTVSVPVAGPPSLSPSV